MVTTLCTEAEAKLHAGTNVNTSLTSGNWEIFINQAEAKLSIDTKMDWVTEYSGADSNIKKAVNLACCVLAASFAIKYDMFSFITITEAQTILSYNSDSYNDLVKKINDETIREMIITGEDNN